MAPRRILVVDDDPAMRHFIAEQLQSWDFEAAVAAGVDEALALLAAAAFDLILSDLQMPRRNGFELLDLVRRDYADTPVILVSSFPAPDTAKRALDAGAIAFLSKPFSLAMLRDALDSTGLSPLSS